MQDVRQSHVQSYLYVPCKQTTGLTIYTNWRSTIRYHVLLNVIFKDHLTVIPNQNGELRSKTSVLTVYNKLLFRYVWVNPVLSTILSLLFQYDASLRCTNSNYRYQLTQYMSTLMFEFGLNFVIERICLTRH